MKIKQSQLIQNLSLQIESQLSFINKLMKLSVDILNYRQSTGRWTILENIEHLNRYGDFYIPEFKRVLALSKREINSDEIYKSGWLGNYFANMMLPDSSKQNTFKSMNPIEDDLTKDVQTKHLQQLNQIKDILGQSKTKNLSKMKCNISISKWIKLRFGDTLRVVIYHQNRHHHQINDILKSTKLNPLEILPIVH